MFIVVYGVQGCGKGTQVELLSKKLAIPALGTGDILRNLAKHETDQGRRIKAMLDEGTFLPDEEITAILKHALPKDVILEGYPRSLNQAQLLDTIATVDVFISISLSDAEAIERMMKRGRSDDTPAAIQHRLDQFHTDEHQILYYYAKQNKLITVNGDQSREALFSDICAVLHI